MTERSLKPDATTTGHASRGSSAPVIDDQARCTCGVGKISRCRLRATQDDGLCDECRTDCATATR